MPPTNQSTDQPINQPTNQSTDRPTNQPIDHVTDQQINQPTNQSTNQPTYLLNNSLMHCTSSEDDSCSSDQGIPPPVMQPYDSLPCSQQTVAGSYPKPA
jgi:hypothetical protein